MKDAKPIDELGLRVSEQSRLMGLYAGRGKQSRWLQSADGRRYFPVFQITVHFVSHSFFNANISNNTRGSLTLTSFRLRGNPEDFCNFFRYSVAWACCFCVQEIVHEHLLRATAVQTLDARAPAIAEDGG